VSTTIGVLTFGVGGNVTSTGLKKWGSYALKGFNAGGYSNLANQALTKGIGNINPMETLFAGIGGSIAAPMAVKVGEMAINKFGNTKTNVVDDINNSKPYANSRPAYGKNQVEDVYNNAKNADGKVIDPSGTEIPWNKNTLRQGQWDMGHTPGNKYSEMHNLYMNDIITKQEFLQWYRNPANYRPELPSTNRGHFYE